MEDLFTILIAVGEITNLVDKKGKTVCPCLPMCDEQLVLVDADVQDWFLGTHVEWVLAAFPKKRYKRTLIFRLIY